MRKDWRFNWKIPASGPILGSLCAARLLLTVSLLGVAPLAHAEETSFDEPLVDAIEHGDTMEASRLIRERHSANSRGKFDVTPLMRAAFKGNFTTTEMLLSAGANPNAVDVGGATALHLAARQDNVDIVKMLIRYGAYVDMADSEGWTPLMRAVAAGKQGAARLLMESGADVNAVNKQNETPLLKAAETKNSKIVRLLLMGGANTSAVNMKGQSAVDIAREKNDPEVLSLLAPYQSPVDSAVSAATAVPPQKSPANKPFFVLSVRDAATPSAKSSAPANKPTDTAAMAQAITQNLRGNTIAPAAVPAPVAPVVAQAAPTPADLPVSLEGTPSAALQPFPVNPNQSMEDIRKDADRQEAEKVAAAKIIADEEERKARLDAAKRAAEKIEQARIEAAKQAAGAIEAAKVAKAKEDAAKEATERVEAAKKAIESERKQREATTAPAVTVIDTTTPPAPVKIPEAPATIAAPKETAAAPAPAPNVALPTIELPPLEATPAPEKETAKPVKPTEVKPTEPPAKSAEKKSAKADAPAPAPSTPPEDVIVRIETPDAPKPQTTPELPPELPPLPPANDKTPTETEHGGPPPKPSAPEVKVNPPANHADTGKTEEELDREQMQQSTDVLLKKLNAIKKQQASKPPVAAPVPPAEKPARQSIEPTPQKPAAAKPIKKTEKSNAQSDAEFWQQLAALENKAFTPAPATAIDTGHATPTPSVAESDLPPLAGAAPDPSEGTMDPAGQKKEATIADIEAIAPSPAAGSDEPVMVPDAEAAKQGTVEVAEAVRVPLSTPRNVRVVAVPDAKPNFDLRSGGWFGSDKSEGARGYWIELASFANEEDAFQLFDKTIAREGLSLRMKTQSMDNPDGTKSLALRVGNFNNSQDAAQACTLFKQGALTCSVIYELGKGVPIKSLAFQPEKHTADSFTYDANPDRTIYWLQLGSFKDESEVLKHWKELSEKHKDVLNALKLSIYVPKTFGLKDARYQMRAGPLYSRFDASDRCHKLKDRDVTCLAVRGD
ncbi:MAG: hypothetical protein EB060_04610 [Proteobacteria bacterium]|nr:hypothetical protein [Pseudomonadota bacterium]